MRATYLSTLGLTDNATWSKHYGGPRDGLYFASVYLDVGQGYSYDGSGEPAAQSSVASWCVADDFGNLVAVERWK